MNDSTAGDWDRFVVALARCLAELPSRATLVLAASGNRYAQFVQFDIRLSAELAGNDFLLEPISPASAQRLRELGWTAPNAGRDVDNWSRTLLWPISDRTLVELARGAAIGLHDAMGVRSPAELRAKGWTENPGALDLSVLGVVGRREPPDRSPARG
ncbi:TY-Chap domain-containing protein [Nocardia jiangsuensis]|uniref:TY-Chap N-terminal domain-containing protein n=1 Tax=Nocardia jiangsuensis TaxID=1691563 RepID=A0ABV8E0Y9_9NOCA